MLVVGVGVVVGNGGGENGGEVGGDGGGDGGWRGWPAKEARWPVGLLFVGWK